MPRHVIAHSYLFTFIYLLPRVETKFKKKLFLIKKMQLEQLQQQLYHRVLLTVDVISTTAGKHASYLAVGRIHVRILQFALRLTYDFL